MRKNKLLLLLALLMTAATGAWAEEQVVYTLDGTQTASNNAYANAGVVNQGSITWMVTGNTSMNPWRIGGKSLSGVDRRVWSENSLDETVTKVTLEFGEAINITVNSITMTVAGDAEFSDVIDTKAVTFSANNTVDVTPTEGKEWKNAYYRFVFNVTVSGSSNKYFQLKSIKFYNDPDAQQQGGSTEPVAGTFTVSLKEGTVDAKNWSIEPKEGLSEGDQVTLQYNGRLKVKGVKATSEAAAPSVPEGAINGKFSVSDGKQVYFSKGNLRYESSKWSFFDNQYDYYTDYSADAWDKFGWSTSAPTYGMNTSTDYGDYSGDFVDWGATMGTGWFTLTSDEWTYLLNTRSASTVGGTENGRYAKAKVNDVQGVILFPDTYTHPDGVTAPTNVNTTSASFNSNSYTVADWTKMESAGCVFLPAAGNRAGSTVNVPGMGGYYWSAKHYNTSKAYYMFFASSKLQPASNGNRIQGLSVRLVQATSDAAAAGAKAAKDATAEDLGKVIGADGNIYDNVDAATAAGTAASAIIAYVGTAGSVDESSSTYKGLAIALTDANSGVTYQWCSEIGNTCVSQTDAIATAITYMNGIASTNTLTSDGHTHVAATAASSYGTARPSDVSAWFLPSVGQWNLIVQGLATKQAGSTVSTDLTTSANNTYKSSNLNSVITDAGGTGFQSGGYWSSTEHTSGTAWRMIFSLGRAYNNSKTASNYVRAVFAF